MDHLSSAAGQYADEVALGAVFAGTARLAAGHLPEHSRLGVEVFAGRSVEDAVMLAATTAVEHGDGVPESGPPAYEVWRSRIREQLRGPVAKAA